MAIVLLDLGYGLEIIFSARKETVFFTREIVKLNLLNFVFLFLLFIILIALYDN
jgi:hypothetical protein